MREENTDTIRSFFPALMVFFALITLALTLKIGVAFADGKEIAVEEPRARLELSTEKEVKKIQPGTPPVDLMKFVQQKAAELNIDNLDFREEALVHPNTIDGDRKNDTDEESSN